MFSGWIHQIADFFDATIAKGADVKLAANWIMGDIAAFMKNEKLTVNEIKLTPEELYELIASIKDGVISGKIGKEVYILFTTCHWCMFKVSALVMLAHCILSPHLDLILSRTLVHIFSLFQFQRICAIVDFVCISGIQANIA